MPWIHWNVPYTPKDPNPVPLRLLSLEKLVICRIIKNKGVILLLVFLPILPVRRFCGFISALFSFLIYHYPKYFIQSHLWPLQPVQKRSDGQIKTIQLLPVPIILEIASSPTIPLYFYRPLKRNQNVRQVCNRWIERIVCLVAKFETWSINRMRRWIFYRFNFVQKSSVR